MTVRRVTLVFAVVCGVAVGLAGCGGLPVHSSVRIERSLPDGDNIGLQSARVLPPGPALGASPADIVTGFLAAQADADEDYGVARNFLAPGVTWATTGAITTYSTASVLAGAVVPPRVAGGPTSAPPTPTLVPTTPASTALPAPEGSTTTIRTTLSLTASLDPQGTYTPLSGQETLPIALRVVDGQWRIATITAGVLLTVVDLQRSFQPETLWWLAPKGGLLVPDVRWFSPSLSSLPTTLVKALLAGPQGRLAGVVRSAIPAGTQLRGSATVSGSDALVDLDRTAAGLSEDQARAVLRQLIQTLGQVPTVNAVRLTVDGQPLPLPQLPDRVTASFVGSADPDAPSGLGAYAPVLRSGASRIGTGRVIPAVARFAYLSLEQVATSPDGLRAAGLVRFEDGKSQLYMASATSGPTPLGARADIVSMSYDSAGELLVATTTGLRRYDASGQAAALIVDPVPGATTGPIDRAVISRDGVRIAVITGPAGARRLWLGDLRSEANGVHVTGLESIAPALGDVRSVAWADSGDLVAIAAGPQHTDIVLWQFTIDGASLTPTVLAPVVVGAPDSVTAMPGSPVLIGAGGRVYERLTSGPRQVGVAGAPAYPG